MLEFKKPEKQKAGMLKSPSSDSIKTHTQLSEEVDLKDPLKKDGKFLAAPGIQFTIGDLHSNAITIMYILYRHGVFDLSQENYRKLLEIYCIPTENLRKEHIETFDKIIAATTILNKEALIRLIGDLLADRGKNDYFIIKILQKLHREGVPFSILLSNHDADFIKALELLDRNMRAKGEFNPRLLSLMGFGASLNALELLVARTLVDRDEIIQFYDECYKPHLKALDYSLSEDQSRITIYSHAGIGLENIKNIANTLGVPYSVENVLALAKTIDDINAAFTRDYVDTNKINTLFTKDSKGLYGEHINPVKHPFVFLTWNRSYHLLNRPDFVIDFVHGHDGDEPSRDNIYNVDNGLGKGQCSYSGTYNILYSRCFVKPVAKDVAKSTAEEETVSVQLEALALKAKKVLEGFPLKLKRFSAEDKQKGYFPSQEKPQDAKAEDANQPQLSPTQAAKAKQEFF